MKEEYEINGGVKNFTVDEIEVYQINIVKEKYIYIFLNEYI